MSAYDDLVDLAFPPPLMKTETLVRLMNVPSRNNKKVLKQVRSGQSTCVLKVSTFLRPMVVGLSLVIEEASANTANSSSHLVVFLVKRENFCQNHGSSTLE